MAAACRHVEDAAALAAIGGNGEIRDGHRVRDNFWREGEEEFSAGESYDRVADIVAERVAASVAIVQVRAGF
jgi:hypothetical protein